MKLIKFFIKYSVMPDIESSNLLCCMPDINLDDNMKQYVQDFYSHQHIYI